MSVTLKIAYLINNIPNCGLNELARQLKVSRRTVHRILKSMEQEFQFKTVYNRKNKTYEILEWGALQPEFVNRLYKAEGETKHE